MTAKDAATACFEAKYAAQQAGEAAEKAVRADNESKRAQTRLLQESARNASRTAKDARTRYEQNPTDENMKTYADSIYAAAEAAQAVGAFVLGLHEDDAATDAA